MNTPENNASTVGGAPRDLPLQEFCCGLPKLERPRFFHGQLLTDQDLNVLLEWTRDHAGLIRYRDGWGVVCGLQVVCNPEKIGHVTLRPGYALDGCGEDIVVTQDKDVDLSNPFSFRRNAEIALDDVTQNVSSGPVILPPTIRVDLLLYAQSLPVAPKTALRPGPCDQRLSCEPSRTCESFDVKCVLVGDDNGDPQQHRVNKWINDYKKYSSVIKQFQEWKNSHFDQDLNKNAKSGEKIREWLLNWMKQHPLKQFCFVHTCVCSVDSESLCNEALQTWILFWIVQDCRNDFLAVSCEENEQNSGVHLARVWLKKVERNYVLQAINTQPPYRRPLGRDTFPANPDEFNLGSLIWRTPEEVCTELSQLGISYRETKKFDIPEKLDDLNSELNTVPIHPCGEVIDCLLCFEPNQDLPGSPSEPESKKECKLPDDLFGIGKRVVGFVRLPVEAEGGGQPGSGDKKPPELGQPGTDYEESPEVEAQAQGQTKPGETVQDPLDKLPDIGKARAAKLREKNLFRFSDIAKYRDSPKELRATLPYLSDEQISKVIEKADELSREKGE